MLGISGWRSRLCTIVFGLGIYLVVSALISTRKINFPTYDPLQQFRNLPPGDSSSLVARSLNSDTETHVSTTKIHSVDSQSPALRHHHHPRNLAAAIDHVQQKRVTNNQRIPPRKLRNGPQIDWCHPLKLKPIPGPVVALASFPGSGNTWLRYLIQQASGYLTGSVYKDYALLKNGFPAESVANGSVLVVKTHEFGPEARKKFDRVILLVRDPFASLKAEFNRRSGGHTGHASPARYKRNGGKYWKNFINTKGEEWARMNLDWFHSFSPENRLVTFYDELLSKPLAVLKTILEFLQVSVVPTSMQCVMDRKEGIYKRGKKKLGIEVFTSGMKAFLQEKQRDVYTVLQKTGYTSNNNSSATQENAKTTL